MTTAARETPETDEDARTRLGDYFAEVLPLDQGTAAAKARVGLGWQPTHPSPTGEFPTAATYRVFSRS